MNSSSKKVIDFTTVYNDYKNGIYNYVFKMLNEEFAAEDITQDVFLKFYENMKKIRSHESLTSWLFISARNEVFGYLRKKKIKKENRINEDTEIESEENLIIKVEQSELNEIINDQLNKIDDDMKEIFLLREYSNLSYQEISEILNIEPTQVKGRLFRTRQKLIEKISKIIKD